MAGVLVVGLWGGLSGIPYILSHADQRNGPVTMFLSGVVVHAVYLGLAFGAPVGAWIGLIAGGLWGCRSHTATDRRATTSADPLAAEVIAKAFAAKSAPASRCTRSSGCVIALAIPGVVLLVWLIHGWWERTRFNRFEGEVTRLGGRVENLDVESWSLAVNAILVDLSSTGTGDADIERLAHDPIFARVDSLSLAGTRITDRGLAVLNERPYFSYLDLSRTSVTDRGLASMSRCCPRMLNLSGTRVTDATVRLFAQQAERFPDRTIDLTDTKVTEESARALATSHDMRILYGSSGSPRSAK
jgi:hypothetical protein